MDIYRYAGDGTETQQDTYYMKCGKEDLRRNRRAAGLPTLSCEPLPDSNRNRSDQVPVGSFALPPMAFCIHQGSSQFRRRRRSSTARPTSV